MFQRLRFLAEGENDGGKGGAGGGGDDAAAKAAAEKAAADASAKAGAGAGDDAAAKAAAEKKAADEKAAAAAKGKDGGAKDGEYKIERPKDMKPEAIDKPTLEAFTKLAKEEGFKPESATKLVAMWQKLNADASAKWAAQDQQWYGQLEKDAEFGGANLKQSEAALQQALKAYDPKGELAADLAKYGMENLPSLAKFLARVGKAGAEDKSQVEKDGKPTPKTLSGAERRKAFYDDMGPPADQKPT